ncbi:hypothetical protein [Streptomyces sp. IBSBF 3352]|uniref:hypothetical protein n=1 Tax=Streptomyces sp. IBSBF 3352 TaxID=2903523 RepID=UPI002FDC4B2F
MKSHIMQIVRWDAPQPQQDGVVCSAHGIRSCARDLVAEVILRDAGSPHIRWTVCQHWLDHEPDVAAYEAGRESPRADSERARLE